MSKTDINLEGVRVLKNADLEKQESIGHGAFGDVFKGRVNVPDLRGKVVAIKTIRKWIPASASRDNLMVKREIELFAKFNGHRSVCPLIGFVEPTNENCPMLVLPYMDNNCVKSILEKPLQLTDSQKYIICYGTARALKILHAGSDDTCTIHRDLKPDNILLDKHYRPFLTDFGLAKRFSIAEGTVAQSMICGSLMYSAPEVLMDEMISTSTDIFSFSLVVYKLITERDPFPDIASRTVYTHGNALERGVRPNIPVDIPEFYKKMMEVCWSLGQDRRPSADEICTEMELEATRRECRVDEGLWNEYISYLDKGGVDDVTREVVAIERTTTPRTKKQADEGDAESQLKWGRILRRNADENASAADQEVMARDVFKYFELSAKQMNQDAMIEVGRCYMAGYGVAADEQKAMEIIEELIGKDNGRAILECGKWYLEGQVTGEEDEEEASVLFKKAAEKPYMLPEAAREYGKLIESGSVKSEDDPADYFKMASDGADSWGMYLYGRRMYEREGATFDEKAEGVRLCQNAEQIGCCEANFFLSNVFRFDKVLRNSDQALKHAEYGASGGYFPCLVEYGVIAGSDPDTALNFRKKAEQSCYVNDQVKWAHALWCGRIGNGPDKGRAIEFFDLAAKNNSRDAACYANCCRVELYYGVADKARQFEEAMSAVQAVLKTGKWTPIFAWYGKALHEGKYGLVVDKDKAMALFISGSKKYCKECALIRADLYKDAGNTHEAKRWYDRATELGAPEGCTGKVSLLPPDSTECAQILKKHKALVLRRASELWM